MTANLPPISDAHFKLIGQIASVWSRIEFIMQLALVEAVTEDWGGGMLLSQHLGYDARLRLLRTFASVQKDHDPEGVKRWNAVFDDVAGAYNIRNKYAHGLWSNGTDGLAKLLIFRARGSLDIREEPVEITAMESDMAAMLAVELKLLALMKAVLDLDVSKFREIGLPATP